jgi:hypothetical protein
MEPIKGLANKLHEHAARVAGILTLFEDVNAQKSRQGRSPTRSCSRSTMRTRSRRPEVERVKLLRRARNAPESHLAWPVN